MSSNYAVDSKVASPRTIPPGSPVRAGTVNSCLASLHTEIAELDAVVDQLIRSIEPVLQPSQPEAKDEISPAMRTSVAQGVHAATERIAAVREKVNRTIDRVDIE